LKSNILKNIGILIIFAAVVLSLKRTAIISLVISLLYYFYSVREVIRKGLPQKIKFLFITVISVFIGYILFNQLTRTFSIDWVGRLSTLLIDGGSGRDVLWKYTWAALLDQNIFQWILGNGYRATEYLGGAHNDFLEVLFDFGIMGLGAYLLFIVLLIKSFFQMKKDKYPNYPAFGVSLIIFIFGSIFSQLVILPHWFLYLPLYWGLIIPHYYRSKISLPFVKHSSNQ
jgi:O-antigen ligase